jgi:uncharacterized protein YhbP (UPF0306 family)
VLNNIETTIREYLPNVIHMSLATCHNGKPWVCEVHFAYDENLTLYFMSLASRRHSKEIKNNKFVSGNIVEQHVIGQAPRGVYFEGEAELLSRVTEKDPAYIVYSKRFGLDKSVLEDAKKGDGHKFYKIKVKKYYVFDRRESKPGQKYELKWDK